MKLASTVHDHTTHFRQQVEHRDGGDEPRRLQVAKEQRVAFEGRLQEALARYKQLFGHLPEILSLEELERDMAVNSDDYTEWFKIIFNRFVEKLKEGSWK